MHTKYNRRTIKLNLFVINISWGIHISCVEYEFTRLSNNNFTLKTKYVGSIFVSLSDTKTRQHGTVHCFQVFVCIKPSFLTSDLQFSMPTEDVYSSGHLVLSHFGTCMCSNVETYLTIDYNHFFGMFMYFKIDYHL